MKLLIFSFLMLFLPILSCEERGKPVLNERVSQLKHFDFKRSLDDLEELCIIPNAKDWKIIFDLNEKEYLGNERRMRVFPDELLIRHTLAVYDCKEAPVTLPSRDKLEDIKHDDYYDSKNILLICSSAAYKELKLPLIYKDDVYQIYEISYRLERNLSITCTFFILNDKNAIVHVKRTPIDLLVNKLIDAKNEAINKSDTLNFFAEKNSQ